MANFQRIIQTDRSKTTLLIRFMVGAVSLSEGIQKFLYTLQLGPGRFEKMGFPTPDFFGYFVGSLELVCGLRSEEHTSEIQSQIRIAYATFCLNTKISK